MLSLPPHVLGLRGQVLWSGMGGWRLGSSGQVGDTGSRGDTDGEEEGIQSNVLASGNLLEQPLANGISPDCKTGHSTVACGFWRGTGRLGRGSRARHGELRWLVCAMPGERLTALSVHS